MKKYFALLALLVLAACYGKDKSITEIYLINTEGLSEKIGTIEEGKNADLIIVDLNDILSKPTNNIFADLVYNTKGYDVDTTIVNGKVLMENKKIKQSVNEVILNCEKIIERIK